MADICDLAQDQMDIEQALLKRPDFFAGESLTECAECGEDIPEQRRKIGGVRFCFECQSAQEKRK